MSHIREDLTDKCSALLLGYRRNCAAHTAPSQVHTPSRSPGLVYEINTPRIADNTGSLQSVGGVHISYNQVQTPER